MPEAYHHGDLARALRQAALALIEEKGLERLSMRAIARHVGVTHTAPSHHYEGLQDLLRAVVAEGFEELEADSVAAVLAAGEDPRARLYAAGLAYIRSATANPTRFRLMFRQTPDLESGVPVPASSTFDRLVALCDALVVQFDLQQSARSLALVCWAMVHGFAHLAVDGVAARAGEGDRPLEAQLLDTFEHLVFRGAPRRVSAKKRTAVESGRRRRRSP